MRRSTLVSLAVLVAALGSVLALRATSAAEKPPRGTVAVAPRTALVTHLKSKLTTNDPNEHDCFGRSLAMNGERLIAGAKGDDEMGSNAGAAYIFRRDSAGGWVQEAKLKAGDARVNDFFGFSVGIDDAKGVAVVGAWQSSARAQGAGSAYVFRRNGDTWTQEAQLSAADATAFAQFGYSIGISGDTIVVGARADDTRTADAGSAYVFGYEAGRWVQQSKLEAPAAVAQDQFGWAVSIVGDTLAVGALGDDEGARNAGAAYVFKRAGRAWTQQAKLVAREAKPEDAFGYSVAASNDRIVVGAYGDDTGGADSGAAYVFERNGDRWAEVQKLTASDAIAHEWFGWSVALAGDTVVVGAWYDRHDSQPEGPLGSAYLFQRDGSRWTERAKLMAQDGRALDLFGWTVAVSGRTVAVGARLDDTAAAEGGAVYIHGL